MLIAQAPHKLNYQGVARDKSGNPLVNQNIGLRLTILMSNDKGNLVYQETQNPVTNLNGLFNIVIGDGTVVAGSFSDIRWGEDLHFLQIEMDETGGINYQFIGTTQLVSVPYALYSEKSGSTELNLDFPDGMDSLIGVHYKFVTNDSFQIPTGKNFHGVIETEDYGDFPITINGEKIIGYSWNNIHLTDGDWIVRSGPDSIGYYAMYINGYLAPQKKQIVYTDISLNGYTVPKNKQFYLTWVNQTPYNIIGIPILVDGVAINWNFLVQSFQKYSKFILINGGSVITTLPSNGEKVFLNGILR